MNNSASAATRKGTGLDRSIGLRKSRSRSALFAVISMLMATMLTLMLAELAVRFITPQQLVSDIIEPDPDVDYRLRPNARGRMSSPEYSASIKINSLGFRGEEISVAKSAGVRRILFLGDSFTFGNGLSENETLPYFVGEELSRRHSSTFEIINGGVYGYCTANELDLFMKYGLPLKPDIVVILVMIHDMFDNPDWYELTSDGLLKRKQRMSQYVNSRRVTGYIPGAGWLREHSHLFKFVGMRVLPILNSGGQSEREPVREINQQTKVNESSPEFYEEQRGPFRVTVALLNRLAEAAKENDAKVILLTLEGGSSSNLYLPHEQLITAALNTGFSDALALPPVLATYQGQETLYFPQDKHWTSAATRFVAPKVADVIARVAGSRSASREVTLRSRHALSARGTDHQR
jgi:acetyltransferase AlgX (SGNH hydrolase-like protein)